MATRWRKDMDCDMDIKDIAKRALRGDDGFVRDDGLSYEGVIYGFVPPDSIFGNGFYQSVRDWALNDDWIADRQLFLGCPDDVTFADVWNAILSGRDVYRLLGIGEFDVLERDLVFERLAEIGEIDAQVIYDAWNVGRSWRW